MLYLLFYLFCIGVGINRGSNLFVTRVTHCLQFERHGHVEGGLDCGVKGEERTERVRSFFFAVALVAKVAMAKVAVLCNVTCQEYIVTLQLYCKVPNFTVFLHP
jgi:hypothetical protein